MMTELLLASNNEHKHREFARLFSGVRDRHAPRGRHRASTSRRTVTPSSQMRTARRRRCSTCGGQRRRPVIADDSGLCVESLGGAPGILSARYGSAPGRPPLDAPRRNDYLLERMEGSARARGAFRVLPRAGAGRGTASSAAQETVQGVITEAPRGTNGFGYDPLFFLARPAARRWRSFRRRRRTAISHGAGPPGGSWPCCGTDSTRKRSAHGPDLHVRQRRLGAHAFLPRGGAAPAGGGRHRQSARRVLQEPGHGVPPDPASWSRSWTTCASALPAARWRSTRSISPSARATRARITEGILDDERRDATGLERLLIGCGGDGTSNEICTALVRRRCRPAGPPEARCGFPWARATTWRTPTHSRRPTT